MSNNEKKIENDSLRKLRSSLDELITLSNEKTEVVNKIPETSALQKYQNRNNVDVVDDEDFSNLVEKVATLQFLGENKHRICGVLSIDLKEFKKIVLSEEYQNVKKLLVDDKKVYILSKLLAEVDHSLEQLRNLVENSDEDRTKLNAIALWMEQTNRLLDEQKNQSNVYLDFAKQANIPTDRIEQVNLAQIILKQRSERGLK